MALDVNRFSTFLENVAEELDIPPRKYQEAVDRYEAVGHWLEDGQYPGGVGAPRMYTQGSFRLGTVVRPIRGGVEADYDIDLVCELLISKHLTDARSVKMMVGDRLSEHDRYRKLLDTEGKRCWTLEYAEQDGIGFHLDVLPSVPDSGGGRLDTSIAITNKRGGIYSWSASNPKGYGEWFDARNRGAFVRLLTEQKQAILTRTAALYASVDEVPDQLVRTPLQRSIQIMKRHRDMRFNNGTHHDYAPISIILTTLAAQLYREEADVYSALTEIVSKLHEYARLMNSSSVDSTRVPSNLIRRTPDGKWYIGNPVNPEENFADRWHEDNHARARAFFSWVEVLKKDFVDIRNAINPETTRNRLKEALGASVVSSHLVLIASETAASSPPKVHISTPARPWRA